MHWRAEDAPVHIYREPRISKEFREDLIKSRGLSDVPQRLSMVQRDNAVELWGATVPGRTVGKVGSDERGNIASGAANDTQGNHISNDHVTFSMESAPITVLNPATNWKVCLFWRGNLAGYHREIL
jgi:hypothetical protein